MHPALPHVGDVTHDPRRGEPGQVAHDLVLQALRLAEREPPVLAARDHVAHVEVVGHDLRLVEEDEAQVQQGTRAVVHAPQQHSLVADVADAGLEHGPRRPCHQRGDRLGRVHVGVDGDADAALPRAGAEPPHPGPHVVAEPVLGESHQRLGGQPDVADVLHVQQVGDEGLEPGPRQVGHIAAGDHHVPHPGRSLQVTDHGGQPVVPRHAELVLADGGGRVAHQVHPRAVAAVLGTRGQYLGEDLGGVAMGEAFDRPHLGLMERVPGGVGMGGPVGAAVAEDRDHVTADRVGVERLGEAGRGRSGRGHHRVEHLRRDQHRHGGPFTLVTFQISEERLGQAGTGHLAQLPDVLHAVGPLPLRRFPLRRGHVRPAGETPPVRLGEFPALVGVRLVDHVAPVPLL